MIYNTKSRSNDTTESQKEKKICFNVQYSQSKKMDNKGVYFLNKMWPLESLPKLKCESRTSLHAVQCQ